MSSEIEIEVGEYKTRGGRDVTVVSVVDGIAIGYYTESGPAVSTKVWRADNGRYFVRSNTTSHIDLVRKKPKRIKREVWLTVRSDTSAGIIVGGGYESLEQARAAKGASCAAIVRHEIDCEEGENLE